MSHAILQDGGAMNMKSIRSILWNTKRPARPVHQQMEFNLPASRLTREDVAVLAGLRRIREDLARG